MITYELQGNDTYLIKNEGVVIGRVVPDPKGWSAIDINNNLLGTHKLWLDAYKVFH